MMQVESVNKSIETANESLKIAIKYRELLRYTMWYFANPESPYTYMNYRKFIKDYSRVLRKLESKMYC